MKANCRLEEKAASKYISTRTGSTGVFPTSFSRKRSLINIFVFFFRETAFVGSTKTIRSCKMEERGCWLFFSFVRAKKGGKTCTITKANNFGGKRRYVQDFLPILWDYKSLYMLISCVILLSLQAFNVSVYIRTKETGKFHRPHSLVFYGETMQIP